MTGAFWNQYQVFCTDVNSAVYTTAACEYLAEPACPNLDCSELTYNLAEGRVAFVTPQGKILNTASTLPNEFVIAFGGDGYVNQTSVIQKSKVKSITSVCAQDAQPKKMKILFSDVQCDTNYCMSFTINSPAANSWVPGHTVYTSSVKTSCCAGCDTSGSAIELAKLFAKDINLGNFCGGLKNRYIKATAICEGDELTVDVNDYTTCISGDCGDYVTTSKTFEAGLIIEGLFYDEYCKCTGCVPARRNVIWDGVNFDIKVNALRSTGEPSQCSWNCNYAIYKMQDLRYSTGDGCTLKRDQREANRNTINPLTQEWSTYDFPAQHADLGLFNCECGTKYCVFEIIVDQTLSYSNGHEDLHIIIGIDEDASTLSDSLITILEANFNVTGLDCACEGDDCGPTYTVNGLINQSNPTE